MQHKTMPIRPIIRLVLVFIEFKLVKRQTIVLQLTVLGERKPPPRRLTSTKSDIGFKG